jgi:phosphoglycerol transferase MdoB-like AlkP superfamily enzyme
MMLFFLVGIVLPMVLAYRMAPAKGRSRPGFMLLGWLGVVILLCMKPDYVALAKRSEAKVSAPAHVYTAADYNRAKPSP